MSREGVESWGMGARLEPCSLGRPQVLPAEALPCWDFLCPGGKQGQGRWLAWGPREVKPCGGSCQGRLGFHSSQHALWEAALWGQMIA